MRRDYGPFAIPKVSGLSSLYIRLEGAPLLKVNFHPEPP